MIKFCVRGSYTENLDHMLLRYLGIGEEFLSLLNADGCIDDDKMMLVKKRKMLTSSIFSFFPTMFSTQSK